MGKIRMRKADWFDYEIFRELYLLGDCFSLHTNEDVANTYEECELLDDEDIQRIFIEEEMNVTKKSYKFILEEKFLYMIEYEDKIIGYVLFFKCGAGRYKMEDFAVYRDYQNLTEEILEKSLKLNLPKVKEISISTMNPRIAEFFVKKGLKRWSLDFFRHEIS